MIFTFAAAKTKRVHWTYWEHRPGRDGKEDREIEVMIG